MLVISGVAERLSASQEGLDSRVLAELVRSVVNCISGYVQHHQSAAEVNNGIHYLAPHAPVDSSKPMTSLSALGSSVFFVIKPHYRFCFSREIP
jgi:hypothetical protein